jgi:hypothetical protein
MSAHGGGRKRSGGRARCGEEEEGGGFGRVGVGARWKRRGDGFGRPASTRRGEGGRRSGDARVVEEGGPVRWALHGRERGHVGHAWNTWAGSGEGKQAGPEETV